MTKGCTLYLASTSPRRQELIQKFGLPVKIVSNHAEEIIDPSWTPEETVEKLSLIKAQASFKELPQNELSDTGILISADTIVVLDGQILGKPKDKDHAKQMLKNLQGCTHHVYTGFTLIDLQQGEAILSERQKDSQSVKSHGPLSGEAINRDGHHNDRSTYNKLGQYRVLSKPPVGSKVVVGYTVSQVTMKPLEEEEIVAYVETGEPMDKAGSYGVQGFGALFVEKIEGDFFSIMGLPLNALYKILTLEFNIDPLKT